MKLVLIGGGGHARVATDVACAAAFQVIGVLTLEGTVAAPGLHRLGDDRWAENAAEDIAFHIAVGGNRRAYLFERLAAAGRRLPALISPTSFVSPSAIIGDGALVVHQATVNAGASVGRNAIVNTAATIEHDCSVGDHSHIAPGAVLAGGVHVGERSLVGTRAVVLPGLVIGDDVTIGAGAVVTRPIPSCGGIWYGNPARRQE
ncbi:MAG: acetyltransferase [Sphingomonas sp.]|nr:acetyltransferase [Sphingomonas sp.]